MTDNAEVTLQPVAMTLVTRRDIYSPSYHEKSVTMPYADFLARLADGGRAMWYNPDPSPTPTNIEAGAQRVTAYLDATNWLRGWFVVLLPDAE